MRANVEALRERTAHIISQLRYGDFIEVKFLDASVTTNVRFLTRRVFATYKRITGYFWCTKLDQVYRQEWLVLYAEETGDIRKTVISIPMVSVMKIEKLRADISRSIKTLSDAGDVYLQGGRHSKYFVRQHGIGEIIDQV